ncbi:MAG: hypothetical protein VKN33_10705 [Candidatus Sericytochromatia bacterium]|nr:hypothetical protein [Candidatus Sericytochromatia bacterium]
MLKKCINARHVTLTWLFVLGVTLSGCDGYRLVSAGEPEGRPLPSASPGLGENPETLGPQLAPPLFSEGEFSVDFFPSQEPPVFVDPVSEVKKATGFFAGGHWVFNAGYFEQNRGALRPVLSFRRYSGTGFGLKNGAASPRYRSDVSVWVYQASSEYPNMVGAPLGILGYAPYFLDETHYLLAVAKPRILEVWAVDGYRPATAWPIEARLLRRDLAVPLKVGSPVTWSVEVNTRSRTAKVWMNTQELGTVSHPMLTDRNHGVALVSNGNYVHFKNFRAYRL